MSRGRKLAPAMEFSTAGMSTRSRTFSPRAMIMCASASAVAAPPMSFFMLSMPASGLMSRPPVSKQTPLPTSVTRGCSSSPHDMSISRGAAARGGAADGVDQRKILRQQIVADDGADCGAVTRGKLPRGVFELGRAHIVRRRIDEIARQRHAFDDALQIVAIEALRQIELDLARFGLAVAREAVGAEREGERGKPRIVRLVGEAIDAVRQMLRQAAGQKQILGIVGAFEPEQDAAEPVLARQQQMAAGLGLETRGVGEGAGLGAERVAHVGIGRRRDEPDRDRVRRPARNEDRIHRQSSARARAIIASPSSSHRARAPSRPRGRS